MRKVSVLRRLTVVGLSSLMVISGGVRAATAAPPAEPSAAASMNSCVPSSGVAAPADGVPDHEELVSPTAARTVAYDGVRVAVPQGAVASPVSIGITALRDPDLAKLDAGMTNVTGGGKGTGYRFTPHPYTFRAPVEVTLPYDPALVAAGLSGQDIHTFFYDDAARCWQPLERVAVDPIAKTVTSRTTHFTDMINGTVTAPEHPENSSFDPNQIKGIQAASPGAKVNLIAPPQPGSTGENQLSYPIEVPPGRLGMQPELGVSYSSGGGDGWLGVGWNLATPAITVDTRWGVPRYDAAKESETYLVDGAQLTPVAHRGTPVARTAEKVFHPRVEGEFAKIVRHGADPKSYTWEVVDKAGTRRFYGGAGATLADQAGNVFMWALREVRDPHDNFVRYHYSLVEDGGIQGGTEPGRNLYIERITYTGRGSTEGRYQVAFTRDRELNETLRTDKQIDGRGGFKRVTADRLRRVDVTLNDDLIRRYELDYITGAFHKTLLKSIAQLDDQGAPFNKHEFSYFDDIRDAQGNYEAFDPAQWTVPNDLLSKDALNLTADQAGNASALHANTSTGDGKHLYIGVAGVPSKSGSIGVRNGSAGTANDGVLALVDVDGDNLPDKVFRTATEAVMYRKNLSGPQGQTQFADQALPLQLPGIMTENSQSSTVGIEAFKAPAAAQLDHVSTFTSTDRYFSDVNGDGITDLVSGLSVLFGRRGANGVPVYGVSDDTPVPVTPGTLKTDRLFGDLNPIRERLIGSFPLLDTVRRWVAPFDGRVRITGPVKLVDETAAARAASKTADGVKLAIQREDAVLWTGAIGAKDNTARELDVTTQVTRGQRLYFRVQSVFDGSLDEVSWNPQLDYLNISDAVDVNNLPVGRYQPSRDFTLGGRPTDVKAPLTGTLHLAGDLRLTKGVTDAVTVLVTRNGAPVVQQTIAAGTTGTVPIDLDVAVQQGQTLKWRVKVDSPIDADAISWIPRAFYTAAEGVERVTGPDGKPLIDVLPPYDVDLYPVNGLTAPQAALQIPSGQGGTKVVRPQLAFDFDGAEPTARVFFTVKRQGQLVGKSFFDIAGGNVTTPAPLQISAADNDRLFFDFSTLNPKLREFLVSHSVEVDSEAVPSAFHSAAEVGAFPQPYRGWGAIGYNGNRDRANQPIVQNDLVIDDSYEDQLPETVDPQAEKEDFGNDPRVNPPKVVAFLPSPEHGRWGIGDRSWVTRDRASSSRMGMETIGLPNGSDLSGATAVPRIARSEQVSVTGGVSGDVGSAGGSLGFGTSTGLLDFMDMNGDGFPDVVSSGGIQYTDPTGGLGATDQSTPDGAVRESANVAGNAKAGSAGRTLTTGRGNASPTGQRSSDSTEAGNELPPFGTGGDIGGSSSDSKFDLIDINGDSLPDRAYDDGKVALNLGYRFGAPEPWRNPAALNDGSGSNFGMNLGFNTDFYGFAGGASYQQGRTTTSSTLADMNGDGLADRVFGGHPIRVAFNTGNGFEPPVDYRGSLNGISADRNATLGGGAYFTFAICFVKVCAVFNPGANVSTGASRSEQALRDLNGDGFVDHVSSKADNELEVAENQTGRTNLLRGVSRPLGGSMEFDYRRDGNTFDMPQSKFVLSEVRVDDGHTGDGQDVQLSTFEYSGGVYDRLEREFNGYATVVTRQRDAGAGDAVGRSVTQTFRNDSFYTRGLPVKTSTTGAAGNKFVETENTYDVRDVANPSAAADLESTTARLFPHLVRTDQRFFEGQSTPGKTTFNTIAYDSLGNVERQFDAGDAGTADDLETVTEYASCPATHIVGVPDLVEVRSGGAIRRKRESTVDCDTGEVSQVRAFLANGDSAVTDMTYRDDGNLLSITEPANKHGDRFKLDFGYDNVVGVHVESVTDSFGLRSTSTHNLKFGEVETNTDVNGKVISNVYDSVGRMVQVTGPYEAPENRATITFEYHPEAAVPFAITRHVDRQADNTVRSDTIDTIAFVDGLGRAIQTKEDAAVFTGENTAPANVMVVSGRVIYDFLGRAVQERFPATPEPKGPANTSFSSAVDSVQPTVRTFDTLDRVTRTVLPDNTDSTVDYGFGPDRVGATQFETITTDANGKTARSYTDVRQLTTAVKQFNPAGGQAVIWTSFGYNALGEKTSVTDDKNNVTTMEYDNFGRRTAVVSPDSGRTETGYDLADNPVRKVTAKLAAENKAIEYDYEFNRLKKIRYPVFTGNDVTYTYGAPGAANNAAGRITNIIDGAGTLTREYGPLGEVTKESRTVTAQGSHVFTFTTQYRFDTWNRMLGITYPDGEVLSYRYDSGGEVNGASGVKAGRSYQYLARLDYDKFGQRALVDTGNGTRTRYTHNALNQRLDNMKAKLAQGYEFQNLNYTYDDAGIITKIQNDTVVPPGPQVGAQVGGPSTENYRYDDLYRLTHADGSYQPKGPKTDKYTLDTSYDSISNITSKNQLHQFVGNGNTQTEGSLTYNNSYTYNASKPHAPNTIGIFTFAYDANGNQTSRSQQPRPRRQLIWDEENRLACSHENVQNTTFPQTPASCDNAGGTTSSRYRYDDTGERIVKDEAQFHIYPNQNFSIRGNHEFKHVYIGTTKLLTKTVEPVQQEEDQQFYNHADHLGSTGFVTDADGGLAEHLKYIPGGETWAHEKPVQPVPHQYTGKEFDQQTGFYYHGARYYDPRTSTWQGTDPALPDRGTTTQALSTYLYTDGNPLSYTDPDGRQPKKPETKFTPGVAHNHPPAGRWADVQANPRSSSTKVAVVCKNFSPQTVLGLAGTSTMLPSSTAASHLDWYTTKGGGKDFNEDKNLALMLRTDSGVQARIKDALPKGQRTGTFAGHVTIEQDHYSDQDFRYAFGAIDRLDFEVNYDAGTIHAWFMDRYEWHPVYPFYKKEDGDVVRETNCVHAAAVELKSGKARDYWMKGEVTIPLKDIQSSVQREATLKDVLTDGKPGM